MTTTTETEQFLAEMMPAQRAADEAIHAGDAGPRIALWSHTDPTTLFGANLDAFGWDNVEPTFHQVASWFKGVEDFQIEVVAAEASGDVAYTVTYEHSRVAVEGKTRSYTLRVTNAYRRENGQWRLVHRHGSFPPDPSTPMFDDEE
jgi:ketosteroid isomerase-like protein